MPPKLGAPPLGKAIRAAVSAQFSAEQLGEICYKSRLPLSHCVDHPELVACQECDYQLKPVKSGAGVPAFNDWSAYGRGQQSSGKVIPEGVETGAKSSDVLGPSYLDIPPRYPCTQDDISLEILGSWRLRNLLNSKHPWFADKQGWLLGYDSFTCKGEKEYLKPMVDYTLDCKLNPYQKHMQRSKHIVRTINKILKWN